MDHGRQTLPSETNSIIYHDANERPTNLGFSIEGDTSLKLLLCRIETSLNCPLPVFRQHYMVLLLKACLKGIKCAINFYCLEIHCVNGRAFCIVQGKHECANMEVHCAKTQSQKHCALCTDPISKAALPPFKIESDQITCREIEFFFFWMKRTKICIDIVIRPSDMAGTNGLLIITINVFF